MSAPWWAALCPAESRISCGTGKHLIRWADGQLTAADHADAEGELVLAALGGDKSECVALVEAWGAHTEDLDVLALGPRSPLDQLAVTWDLVRSLRSAISPQPGIRPGQAQRHGRLPTGRLRPRSMPMRQASPELRRAQARRAELIGLFALGRDFQLALSGTVAAAWSAGPAPGRDLAAARPALTGALAGLAPAAADWLGIDPEAVRASLHEGPGWGTVELAGGTLRAALPVHWLAAVWTARFPVVGGHLVVDVLAAAWPQAQVRALARPGAVPTVLSIRYDGEHWSVAETD